jgi:hypothetical protein
MIALLTLGEVEIVDDKKEEYYTPLILRTGFLHSYWRTGGVLVVWFALNILTYIMMDVVSFILTDPWTYMFFPLLAIVVYIAKTAVSGYDDLFGIFDENFDQNLKLYKTFHKPETENQKRISKIYRDDKFYDIFKEKVRNRLFGGYEKRFLYLVIIFSPLIVYLYYLAYLDVGVYNAYGPLIWFNVYVISNLVIGLAILTCLASLVGIVFSMIRSISDLEDDAEEFKIAKYIKFLQGERYESLDDAMGYDSF